MNNLAIFKNMKTQSYLLQTKKWTYISTVLAFKTSYEAVIDY